MESASTSEGQDVEDSSKTMKLTFELVEEGKKEIKTSSEYQNAILVLGGTGAGKSSFTQWIAGDKTKLIAEEVEVDSGEFLLYDNRCIGQSNILSHTVFPELVIDSRSKTAFYDCPGFGDTRKSSYDLATTYFIKQVVECVASIKIIFVIRYPSVRQGVDREDFMILMRHATDLIKDILRFKNSIALMVTKIDNTHLKRGDNHVLVNDEIVIKSISNFLLKVKKELEIILEEQYCPERNFYENAIKIIDILLIKNGERFQRIGLFRRPEKAGLLSENI